MHIRYNTTGKFWEYDNSGSWEKVDFKYLTPKIKVGVSGEEGTSEGGAGQLTIFTNYSSPVNSRFFIGDGTGYEICFSSRSSSTTVDRFKFNDTGYLDILEMPAPSNAAANRARIFAQDNGAGKTQICAIFSSGAVQVIATEP